MTNSGYDVLKKQVGVDKTLRVTEMLLCHRQSVLDKHDRGPATVKISPVTDC